MWRLTTSVPFYKGELWPELLSSVVLCSARLHSSAARAMNLHYPGLAAPLVLAQLWRSHGSHRDINRRSDPTPLSTQSLYGSSMRSLSHFENFACPAALPRRVPCHRNISSFTGVMINATTLQHLPTPLS